MTSRTTTISQLAAGLLPAFSIAQTSLDELARDVDRAESLRTVKNLQRTYAQYAQYGLWNEMADLFAQALEHSCELDFLPCMGAGGEDDRLRR